MKESAIIFGASTLGSIAYRTLRNSYDVVAFTDNNTNKWNTTFEGLDVIAPEKIINYKGAIIIIASQYFKEISSQLQEMGIRHFFIYQYQLLNSKLQNSMEKKLEIPILNLGRFLSSIKASLRVENLTLLRGGSTLLDYAFLKGLILKFNLETFLEIGTWSGESIAVVSEVAKRCYSVSLPDENLKSSFDDFWGKNNFSRFFSLDKKNIKHFYEDSKTFDFSQIKDTIDLVFIDGDHSYSGVKSDTKRIFEVIDLERTIVVWHDFKTKRDNAILSTVNAVFEALPNNLHHRVYGVDSNICGVYLPDKYKSYFSFENDRDEIYSYEVSILPQKNTRNDK